MSYVRDMSYAVLELSVSFSNKISRTRINKAISPTLTLPKREFLNVKQVLVGYDQERR